MVTPKEYKKNLENGIITTEMLNDALYSVNKRAKNYRDAERKCRYQYYGQYADANRYKKEGFYAKKEALLQCLEPSCIHREFAGFERERIYSYQSGYMDSYVEAFLKGLILWQNSYLDRDTFQEVEFFDRNTGDIRYRYYLYYVCGDRSYHRPIEEADISKYDLGVIDIGELSTEGHEYLDLLSMQFVDKMLAAIQGDSVVYQKTIEDCPPEYPYEVPTFGAELTEGTVSKVLHMNHARFVYRLVKQIQVDTDDCLMSDYYQYIKIVHKSSKKGLKNPRVNFKEMKPVWLAGEEAIHYVYEKLSEAGFDNWTVDYIVSVLCSPECPVYDKIIKYIKDYQMVRKVQASVKAKVDELWDKNKTKVIKLDDIISGGL